MKSLLSLALLVPLVAARAFKECKQDEWLSSLDECVACTPCGEGLYIKYECTAISNTVCGWCGNIDAERNADYLKKCNGHQPIPAFGIRIPLTRRKLPLPLPFREIVPFPMDKMRRIPDPNSIERDSFDTTDDEIESELEKMDAMRIDVNPEVAISEEEEDDVDLTSSEQRDLDDILASRRDAFNDDENDVTAEDDDDEDVDDDEMTSLEAAEVDVAREGEDGELLVSEEEWNKLIDGELAKENLIPEELVYNPGVSASKIELVREEPEESEDPFEVRTRMTKQLVLEPEEVAILERTIGHDVQLVYVQRQTVNILVLVLFVISIFFYIRLYHKSVQRNNQLSSRLYEVERITFTDDQEELIRRSAEHLRCVEQIHEKKSHGFDNPIVDV